MNQYSHEIINDDTHLQLHVALFTNSLYYSPPHWHGHLEILFIQKGYMTAYINEQKYTLQENDILVVNPNELHATRTYGEADYLLLQIPRSYFSRFLPHASSLRFQEYFPSIIGNTSLRKMRNGLRELCCTYQNAQDGYLLHFSSVLYEFLYELYRNYSEVLSPKALEKENRNFARMEEILQYLRSNYRSNLSLKEVAGMFHMSPEYFCRIFKKHTGQTFLQYINAIRMMYFYQDLLRTDYSITELMERHGISNYKVFLREFKSSYGCSPSGLRKR